MFQSLIRDASTRFNLGDNAARFVRLLVDGIFDETGGGFAGLQQRFADAGLAGLFQSFIGTTPGDNVLQPDQFSASYGEERAGSIASALDVPRATVNLAGAYLLPKIIGLLTANGAIPTSRPQDYERWFVDAAPAASVAPAATVSRVETTTVRETVPVEPERRRNPLLWLLPLLLLLGLLFAWRGCHREAPAPAPGPVDTTRATPATPAADKDAFFDFANDAGKVRVSGRVPTDADKQRLWNAVTSAFGADNVSGDIAVDASTRPVRWADCVATTLPTVKTPGLRFRFEGERLNIDTSGLADEQRFELSRALRQGCGGYETKGLWDRAAAAFASLKRPYEAPALVNALNLMEIYFDTDSAAITRDSLETLTRAAEAIKGAPANTRIEVGGHTDATGDAAHNLTLSEQRANAVVQKLVELGVDRGMLVAKGYGQTKPKASNDTEDGRAQNRRMEFTVLK